MLLNKPQRTAIKWLFFILLSLAFFDIIADVLLRVVFDLPYDHKLSRIINWFEFNVTGFIFWYFIRKNVNNTRAVDFAIGALGLITLIKLVDVFVPFLVRGMTSYPILNLVIFSVPFLVFGFVYHKNTKGLWYFLTYFIISGIAVGTAYGVNDFLRNALPYRSVLKTLIAYQEGAIYIAPIPMLYYKLIWIVNFVVFFYMHKAIKSKENDAFQFKKLDVRPMSNLTFSVVFWVSRLVIITMIFSILQRIQRKWGLENLNSTIQEYIWVLSVIVAAYFFTLIYRNFLTSYFVSKGIKPGWKYIFINLPIINFFVWLYVTFFVNVQSSISLSDRVDKVTALFKNSDRNNNIKVAFYVVTLLGAVIRLISSRGRIDPIVISLISAVLGLALLALYFKYARTALFLFGLNALIVLAAPFGEMHEASPIFIYSMIYTLLWISIFHFDKYTYANELSPSADGGLGQLEFIKKDIKPFEPKELTNNQKTYWKTIFITLLAAIIIKMIILIAKTDFGFSYVRDGFVLRLLGSIFVLTIVAIFTNNVNTAIKKKTPLSKTTKVLEIVSYGIGIWYLISIIGGFISLIVMAFNDYYNGPSALMIIIGLFLNIVLVVSLILVFIARYRFIGSYETSFNQMEFIAKNLSVEKLKSQNFHTLEDRLVLCKTCTNRKPTTAGMVCGLTSERPTFEAYCVDYIADEKRLKRQHELKSDSKKGGFFGSWKGALVMALLGFIRAGLRGFADPFGLIFLILGFAWLIAALVSKKD